MTDQTNDLNYQNGDVLTGSSKLNKTKSSIGGKDAYMVSKIRENKAFSFYRTKLGLGSDKTASKMTKMYQSYRDGWARRPLEVYKSEEAMEKFRMSPYPPQCIDLEVASICDLACPFCFRQFTVTPDKIIDEKLALDLIFQAAEMNVPSMKFNWRGEPLLHPKLPKFIHAAKSQGIIETLINTNGTQLNESTGRKLIEAGLDVLILSFDGGTKETYEKMRPGRFEHNSFENVVENLTKFHKLRDEMDSPFPYIKVQMIMTEETRNEIDAYHNTFQNIADEVTVTQYTERGGSLDDLPLESQSKFNSFLKKNNLPSDTPFMMTADGQLYASEGRIPCAQPLQRLMITYEGRVGMCCFDWGARHTVGFVSTYAYEDSVEDYLKVKSNIENGKKEFSGMNEAQISNYTNTPENSIKSLKDIWQGYHITQIRNIHQSRQIDSIEVCKGCTFKDTYDWQSIS
jgi:wyosine [tRNA(Phe)-imidazoG37] synthetase (radical SAM superfamily)